MATVSFDTKQTANILEVSERTVRRYIEKYKLKAKKGIYGGYRISEYSIRCFIANNDKYTSEDVHRKISNLSDYLFNRK